MLKDKRGIFFTSLAIVLISLFLISASLYSAIEGRRSIQKRIETLNNFVFSVQEDIGRQTYISGYRSILSIENYITNKGAFVKDARGAMVEALMNGTINSENMSLMEGFELKDWNPQLTAAGNKMNIVLNYSLANLSVTQDDPWSITIQANVSLFVQDKNNLASWNTTRQVKTQIEIVGFEDPFYVIGTGGLVANKINRTAYRPFVTNGNNVSNLSIHNQNGLYIESPLAPSFLKRLEGNFSADPNGIESLVYITKLVNQGMTIKDKSIVDYVYFSSDNPPTKRVNGMPSWFKLDNSHLAVYSVENISS